MTDYRDRVKADRGLIKMIELAIPGFRGYRKKEDLRIADRLLREELANRLSTVQDSFESFKEALIKKNEIDLIEDAGNLVKRIRAAKERMLHAEQGYTGVSPDYRIEEPQLNMMYEWDLSLLDIIETLQNHANNMRARASAGEDVAKDLEAADLEIESYEQIFDRRREFLAGLTLKGD